MLLELPLLRLGTEGAAAMEVGGDIVRSAVGAPGKSTRSTKYKGILQQCKHINDSTQPFNAIRQWLQKNILKFEGWGWCMICHP